MNHRVARIASGADRGAEVEAYWKACAAIRDGEVAAGVARLVPLAGTRSAVLRERVRQVLAKHGAAMH